VVVRRDVGVILFKILMIKTCAREL
jgi:hypothetical protein